MLAFSQKGISQQKISLPAALEEIERKFDLTFSYADNKINEHSVLYETKSSAKETLKYLFSALPLNFEFIDSTNVLIYSKNEVIMYCGYLIDSETKQGIAYANVFNEDQSLVVGTNEMGYFEVESGKIEKLYCSFIGYENLEINASASCPKYELNKSSYILNSVGITEYLADGISQTRGSNAIIIEPPGMQKLPGNLDGDILNTIQFLPGINSPNESLDGIFVRGGTPDQNLILWDGIPVFQASHFFGTVSAFNPFLLDSVNVYRSGIGSKYGGRVSSVIDINTSLKRPEHFGVGFGMDLTQAHLDIHTPLWKNAALFLSTRRSITDNWVTPTFRRYSEKVFQDTKLEDADFGNPQGNEFRFNDGNLKLIYNPGKNKITFSMLGGLNFLDFETQFPRAEIFSKDSLALRHGGAILKWERDWSEKFKSTISTGNSSFDYDYQLSAHRNNNPDQRLGSTYSRNIIRDGHLNMNFELKTKKNQTLQFGYQFSGNDITFDIGQIENGIETFTRFDFENRLHSIFGDYSIDLSDILHLDMGLRYNYHEKINNDYFAPRLSARAILTENIDLKLSTSKLFQFISQVVLLNVNDLGLSNNIWVAANEEKTIPVIESNQWTGGLVYSKADWTLDIEGYVKELTGITSFSSFGPNDNSFGIGSSRIRGIDVLIKKRFKNYRSWLSWSLSQAVFEFNRIETEPFPANHDQRNVLQWVHLFKKNKWEYSAGITLKSGLPFTQAAGIDTLIQNGVTREIIEYESTNASRLKPYMRIEASLVYNFGRYRTKGFRGYIGFSIQNITNNLNVLRKRYALSQDDFFAPKELLTIEEYGLRFTPNFTVNLWL
jgi:outer membrane cobalamin receptor